MESLNCLHRWLGNCRDCSPDFDPQHFPNNFNCPRFAPVHTRIFMVVDEIEPPPEEAEDEDTTEGE